MRILITLGGAIWVSFIVWTLLYFRRRNIWRDARPFVRTNVLITAPALGMGFTAITVNILTGGPHDAAFWPVTGIAAFYFLPSTLWVGYWGGLLMHAVIGELLVARPSRRTARLQCGDLKAPTVTRSSIPMMLPTSLSIIDQETWVRKSARAFFWRRYRELSVAWHLPCLVGATWLVVAGVASHTASVYLWFWMAMLALIAMYPLVMYALLLRSALTEVRKDRGRQVRLDAEGIAVTRSGVTKRWEWVKIVAPWELDDLVVLPVGRWSYIWLPRRDLPANVAQILHDWVRSLELGCKVGIAPRDQDQLD